MTNKKQYCPAVIDIEASGFGPKGYPIEVGVITGKGERFCQLITPPVEWEFWDSEAASCHQITRDVLYEHGHTPTEVANELNSLLKGMTVHSDGWVVDKPWLVKLFQAADIAMQFNISPIEVLLNEQQMHIWHIIKKEVTQDLKLQRHRASSDAKVIQETYMRLVYGSERKVS